jgi:protein-disulfide isomerase
VTTRGRAALLRAAFSLCCAALPVTLEGQTADLESVGVILGRTDAPVVIVEYADFACSACAEFAGDTWPALLHDYVETGVVRWHLVPFELGFRNSEEGARAGMCAASLDRFWPMHDLLYARREEWEGERRPKAALVAIAIDAGVDPAAFQACYESDAMREPLEAANRAARSEGIRGTPTFFVNGVRVQGALPLEVMVELIEAARRSREQTGR